ncbi:ThiF family adenylyltransferase [Deinococcus aestuarii]|uniref:ThiF family adenylyltransferase n=1 Tax=Deinococcus aestuarii TaxID=2774531 RepID=UPI001C0E7A2B|nr:ThiF family adenylyltransferase [Deinococcus aestuarii]
MNDPRLSFLAGTTDLGGDVLADLRGTVVRVHVGLSALRSPAGQVLAYQYATLAARLFDQVVLDGDPTAPALSAVPIVRGPFLPALTAHLPTLRRPIPGPSTGRELRIAIGDDAPVGDLHLGATGWGARVSRLAPQPVEGGNHTLGALAAGTLGAAETFKLAFEGRVPGAYIQPEYTLSLLHYGPIDGREPALPEGVHVDLTLFGAGSIGMGYLQGVALTPRLTGRITAVDNGRFDERNPVKYSLLDAASAEAHLAKAPWVEATLRPLLGDRLDVRGVEATAAGYVAGLPVDYVLPLAVSAVDTFEARLEIQDALPGFLLNAGIDGTLVEVSAHRFGTGACLGCLAIRQELESWDAGTLAQRVGLTPGRTFALIRGNEGLTGEDLDAIRRVAVLPPDALATLDSYLGQPLLSLWNRVGYAESAVQGSAAPVNVSSAFVSAFAGLLLLAETLKFAVPQLRGFIVDSSYRQQLLGVPAGDVLRYQRDTTGACLCHSGFRQRMHTQKYPNGDAVAAPHNS